MFIQIFYWSTNQVIVQRAMAAKSLAGQGVLFASAMKLVGPLMLCLPGIIALHMPDLEIEKMICIWRSRETCFARFLWDYLLLY